MKRLRNIVIIAAVLLVGLAACQGNNQSQYETVPAAKGNLSATVGATGTVRSNQSAQLSWQTTGTVDQVKVKGILHVIVKPGPEKVESVYQLDVESVESMG